MAPVEYLLGYLVGRLHERPLLLPVLLLLEQPEPGEQGKPGPEGRDGRLRGRGADVAALVDARLPPEHLGREGLELEAVLGSGVPPALPQDVLQSLDVALELVDDALPGAVVRGVVPGRGRVPVRPGDALRLPQPLLPQLLQDLLGLRVVLQGRQDVLARQTKKLGVADRAYVRCASEINYWFLINF